MTDASQRLLAIRRRIEAAAQRADRDPAGIALLAVSKTFPAEAIRELSDAGQRAFGESRQQEAEEKIPQLPPNIDWHFIGHLQRNKVRKVLSQFSTIHGISSLRLAQHVNRVAEELRQQPSVYLQVNIGAEATKQGFLPDALLADLPELAKLRHLRLMGLMAIPPEEADPERARHWFAAMRELRDRAREISGLELPGLSMGMSGDFETAIEEGATIVRVGSALFGDRDYSQA